MTVLIGDLVRDVELATNALKGANDNLDTASRRLIDGLSFIGIPLNERGVVVVGGWMIIRKYSTLPVELQPIANLAVDAVVVAADPSTNPHSDLP